MKIKYIALTVITMLLAITLTLLGITKSNAVPLVAGELPEPDGVVTAFFDEMKAGEYQKAMERVGNYDTLGFEKQSTELIELYKQTIIECYDVKLIDTQGERPDSPLEAVQRIELTYLDCRLLQSAVSEITADAVKDYMNHGNVIENDEQAMAFVNDAFCECLSEPEQYCVTEQFDVLLKYDGESWRIELEQPLVDALFGHIGSLQTEGVE